MGDSVEIKFNDCLKRHKLTAFADAKKLVKKELAVAATDLKTAKSGLGRKQWKWSTIQAYYAMFHIGRALLYSKGYQEKSHYCLRIALDYLFVSPQLLSEDLVDAFQVAKMMRENADYEEEFSEVGARKLVRAADDFLKAAKGIVK